MFETLTPILLAGLLLPVPLPAQEGATQRPAADAPATTRPGPQLANVRIELTIVDQRGDITAAPKAITMVVEDRQNARIRTGRANATLNLDARSEILREGRIRVMLTLEYTPQDGPDRASPLPIQESITALVDDGKALTVSLSADPSSDRKVRLDVKATIVK